MKNRIKFIYRPKDITRVDKESFSRINISPVDRGINIKNNSANWITIPELTGNTKINKETLLLAPWSDQTVKTTSVVNYYNITLIDDHGNYFSEKIKTAK